MPFLTIYMQQASTCSRHVDAGGKHVSRSALEACVNECGNECQDRIVQAGHVMRVHHMSCGCGSDGHVHDLVLEVARDQCVLRTTTHR